MGFSFTARRTLLSFFETVHFHPPEEQDLSFFLMPTMSTFLVPRLIWSVFFLSSQLLTGVVGMLIKRCSPYLERLFLRGVLLTPRRGLEVLVRSGRAFSLRALGFL